MTTAFSPVLPEGASWTRPESFDDYDWCNCAQMAHDPCALIHTAEGREVLRQHANPDCVMCKGSGVDPRDPSQFAPGVEWGEGNAEVLFNLLGIADRLSGQLPIKRMHMHVQKARTALVNRGTSLERPMVQEMGTDGDAIVLRLFSRGLDVVGMGERIDALEKFLEEAASLGCQEVSWS